MAKTLLRDVLVLATTLVLVACGSGGDGGGGSPSGSASTSAASTSAASTSAASTSAPPSATPSAASVALAWTANTDSDLAGYKVYASTSSGIYGTAVATVPASTTSFVVTGLQTGVTYFFVITAVDTSGNESPRSTEVSATPS